MKNIVLSFIGKLPDYIYSCVHQIRLYTDEKIFLILDDLKSPILEKLINFKNIEIIKYESVNNYCETLSKSFSKFVVINGLKDRSKLFYRAFERFYLLYNLMVDKNINDVLFLEIDNLIYEDPKLWTDKITKDIAFMIDNKNRCSTGICYVKKNSILKRLLDFFDNDYLNNNNSFFNEMTAVYEFYIKYKSECYILPSCNNNQYGDDININFNNSKILFDPLSYGIFLLGMDTFHTGGKIVLNTLNKWGCLTHLTQTNVIWKVDKTTNYKKPYFVDNNGNCILIANLHVHSKDLVNGLSSDV